MTSRFVGDSYFHWLVRYAFLSWIISLLTGLSFWLCFLLTGPALIVVFVYIGMVMAESKRKSNANKVSTGTDHA